VFEEIEAIVYIDTGKHLRWRHLHSTTLEDFDRCILHWSADQHGGQAKGIPAQLWLLPWQRSTVPLGLGLHLQALANELLGKYDLHETFRLLSSLSPYEHLHRIFRLCVVHAMRNIRKCPVSEKVRNLMRSLICMRHDSWDATLHAIEDEGGKPGKGNVPYFAWSPWSQVIRT
jgi:hypothetical protein